MKSNVVTVVSASASGFALASVSTMNEQDERLLRGKKSGKLLSAYPDEDDDAQIIKDDDEE